MTIWTPELDAGKPAYVAIADAIGRDRDAGALAPGEKLPPHRTLAYALGLTVGTVTRGYAEAARRGLARGEVGRGTFIADAGRTEEPDAAFARKRAEGADFLNLTITRPAVGLLTDALRESLSALAAGDLVHLADYCPVDGDPTHRRIVADWLAETGAAVATDRVVLSAGAQNALALAAAGLFRPGDAVAVDPLTYPGFKTAAGLFGLNLVAVDGDDDGMLPEALEAAAWTGARGVYLMPTLHNPTMATMPLARRIALADIARSAGLTVIEDDVYGFLSAERQPMFAELAPEHTALVGSVSKFMAPGLRFGWIAPPPERKAEVVGAMRGLAWMTSPLMAEAATSALASGMGARMAEAQRTEARARMSLARERLAPWLGATPEAAMHVWLSLPEPWRADAFVAEAEARGVAVTGAGAFAVGRGRAPHAVRFGLGPATRERLAEGMAVLAGLLAKPPRAGAAVV